MAEERFHRPYRWLVLLVYTLVAGASQMLWLNFAPLLGEIQKRYGVSELLASTLVLVFPLLYVLLSLPAGVMTDRRGYRRTVGLGAVVMTVFAAVRVHDQSFYALLAGQLGIAAAQPFVLNGISKLVSDWFDAEQGALATGLGTVGMFLGMAAGMGASPALAAGLGLRGAMIVFAAITAGIAAAFLLLARENGPGSAAHEAARSVRADLKVLLRDRDLRIVFALCFLGLGFFNGLTTWLEGILAPNGVSAVDAGMVGALLILGGIGGAATIPALSDRLRRRKPFVVGCAAGALALLYPLCTLRSYGLLLLLAGALGFLFLPAYALLLEMSAELAGPELAGSATGILMLTGNAGGVVTIVLMPIVKGSGTSWTPAVLLMLALLIVTLLLALVVGESFRARGAR
jgi:predicted MFS family arabinose efflux permease